MSFFGETEARYAALAGLVQDARVLDLSDHGDARCIDALITAAARSVTICAPESVREQLTTHSADVVLTPPIELPLQFAPASFDVVICFDLASRLVHDSGWASALREVLTPEGAIITSSVSADDAVRVLGPIFGVATVFAQTPLVGHMLYDTEADELEPELDRTWADSDVDDPTRYVVVFAPDKRHSEKLTLVQVPFAKWDAPARDELQRVTSERDAAAHELTLLREQSATNQLQLGSTGGELEATRSELQNARNEIELLVSEVAALRSELESTRGGGSSALEEELERHRNDRASLEAQIADLLQESSTFSEHRLEWQARLDAVESELVAERARVAELTAQSMSTAAAGVELEERLSDEAARNIALDQEIAAERQRASELEALLAAERERIADLTAQLEAGAARAAGSEEMAWQLERERAQHTSDLNDERDRETTRAETAERERDEASALLTSERQAADELRRDLEAERGRRRELEAGNDQARETEELLARARLETVDAVEALRQERVRGEQLLTRLVDLEQRLAPGPEKAVEELTSSGAQEGDVGTIEETAATRDVLSPGGEAIDGKS